MPRFTDMMKKPETQIINQDSKRYEFTPGEGGSLIVQGKKQAPLQQLDEPRPATAKIIGPDDDKEVSIGSTRG